MFVTNNAGTSFLTLEVALNKVLINKYNVANLVF